MSGPKSGDHLRGKGEEKKERKKEKGRGTSPYDVRGACTVASQVAYSCTKGGTTKTCPGQVRILLRDRLSGNSIASTASSFVGLGRLAACGSCGYIRLLCRVLCARAPVEDTPPNAACQSAKVQCTSAGAHNVRRSGSGTHMRTNKDGRRSKVEARAAA